jgi:hypothetical protein
MSERQTRLYNYPLFVSHLMSVCITASTALSLFDLLSRFQLPTAMSTKMTVFWGMMSRVIYETIALMMEVVSTFETSVNIYQTTWRKIPENNHLQVS